MPRAAFRAFVARPTTTKAARGSLKKEIARLAARSDGDGGQEGKLRIGRRAPTDVCNFRQYNMSIWPGLNNINAATNNKDVHREGALGKVTTVSQEEGGGGSRLKSFFHKFTMRRQYTSEGQGPEGMKESQDNDHEPTTHLFPQRVFFLCFWYPKPVFVSFFPPLSYQSDGGALALGCRHPSRRRRQGPGG